MRGLSVVFLLFLTFTAKSQSDGGGHFTFFSVITTNIDSSVFWYQEYLGFELVDRNKNDEYGFEIVNLQASQVRLEIIETSKTIDRGKFLKDRVPGTRIAGFFKIGLAIENFEERVNELVRNGVSLHGEVVTDPYSNKKMVIVLDPDGNRIQFFEK